MNQNRKYRETVVVVLISFLIPLAINTILNYFTQEMGYFHIGEPLQISELWYLPIDIGNYSQKPTNGLELAVPAGINPATLLLSRTLMIERDNKMQKTNSEERFTLSRIEPNTETTILIPIIHREDKTIVRVVNAHEMNYIEQGQELKMSPLERSIRDAFIYALITAIAYGLVVIWMEMRSGELLTQADQLKTEINNMQKEAGDRLNKVESRLGEQQGRCKKHQILLQARIRDLAKELSFWRDTIRKMLYETGKSKEGAELLIDQVTATLKTYATREVVDKDFEAISIMAGLMQEARKVELPEHS